jgi:putative ABC transport system permease protein
MEFEIVGGFEYFPTWYPNEVDAGPLFIGNLEHIFQQAGGNFPYDVWLQTDPSASHEEIAEGVEDRGMNILYWHSPQAMVKAEQQRPQRQGLFGVLSVGFVGAALLTVIGFALYAFFSFRQRFIELGILRAIGLSSRQMIAFLGWELVFLMGIGLGVGTGLGVWISNFFIPYLQVGTSPEAQIPPFVVHIHWPSVFQIYLLFGALFIFALAVLVALLMRMKIFQAVKMGETA